MFLLLDLYCWKHAGRLLISLSISTLERKPFNAMFALSESGFTVATLTNQVLYVDSAISCGKDREHAKFTVHVQALLLQVGHGG